MVGSKCFFKLCTLTHEHMMTDQPSDQRQTDTHAACFSLAVSICKTSRVSRNIFQSSVPHWCFWWFMSFTTLCSPQFVANTSHTYSTVCVPCIILWAHTVALSYLRAVCQLWPAPYLGATERDWFLLHVTSHFNWMSTVYGLLYGLIVFWSVYFIRLVKWQWSEADGLNLY